MEKVDLDYLRKQWKNEKKYYWESMEKEILEYFEMIKVTKYVKTQKIIPNSKEEMLREFSLTEEKLKDPLFIPEILKLLEQIKKNNYDIFPNYWVSDNYNHHERASYIYHNLIPELTPLAEKIIDFKVNQFNSLFDQDELSLPKKRFINRDFSKFGLIHYDSFIDIINSIAYDEKFYILLPNLLRTLFENILNDIFSTSLKNNFKYLYFDQNRGRIADFSVLIELLNQLSKIEYKDRIRSNINIKTINILKDVKSIGNLSVHEVLRKITKSYADEIQDDIDLVLEALLVSYNKLIDADIEIESERLEIIENKIGLKKKSVIEKKEKVKKEKTTDLLDPKKGIEFFIEKISSKQNIDLMNRFDDDEFKKIFEKLFTKIKRGSRLLELWSHTFIIGIMADGINHIMPFNRKNEELKKKWKSLSIEEQLKIFLDDFKDRVKLVYGFNL